MSTTSHNLLGFFPYKMDAKGRVSIPGDWRAEIANGMLLLLLSSNEKLPTLRVLTESEFEKMKKEVDDSDLSPADKRKMLGALSERCTKTSINDQGKLSIPKNLLSHPGLEYGESLGLCGRGDYIEILNEENYQKLRSTQEPVIEALDANFGFF